ncbi:MAG: type I-E CRISPR-associated protein Cas5/CasD [Eubacteriales bacterium]
MGIPILLLRLEGVLQSWDDSSKLDYRKTGMFPTKSGVIGLLGCALGLERTDTRLGEISNAVRMMVRADRPGELLVDFHTVTAEKLLNASGEQRSNGNTIISHRSYLQDASFLVGLQGSKALLEELSDALLSPKWSVYLGRKSCVPSVPVIGLLTEDYTDLWEAMSKYPLAARHKDVIMVEMDSNDDGYERRDQRVSAEKLQYTTRRVTVKTIKPQENDDVSE